MVEQLKQSIRYESALERYTAELSGYERQAAVGRDLREQSCDWKRGKASLVRLRKLIKAASAAEPQRAGIELICRTTGVQRQLVHVDDDFDITVDDDFDITVDGQPLATLSGSGKAVANLALRIGLGQVLTNNVLSLFIGDEIDASLDAGRSECTGQTLRGLMNSVAQILLVTHKGAEAKYSVTL